MKKCSKCKKEKSLEDFGRDKYAKDKLRCQCKKCANESAKKRKRKKIKFECESCHKEKEVDYYTNKRRKTNFCLNCVSKKTQTGKKRPHLSGKNSSRWKGGEYITSDGYRVIKTDKINNGRAEYKREHILVMEKHLGRKLKTAKGGGEYEQVHHIDGNKLNNNIENLLLCSSTSEHKKIESQLRKILNELIKKGVIVFNRDTNNYECRIT